MRTQQISAIDNLPGGRQVFAVQSQLLRKISLSVRSFLGRLAFWQNSFRVVCYFWLGIFLGASWSERRKKPLFESGLANNNTRL